MAAACSVMVWLLRVDLSPRLIAMCWLIGATVSAWMGLFQYFGQAQIFAGWVHTSGLGEAFANLRQRNQFATLTSIGLLALLWYAAQQTTVPVRKMLADRRTVLLMGVGAMLALGNAVSGSRTGLFQWVLVFGLALMWKTQGQWRVLGVAAFALSAYVVASLLLPWALETITGVTSSGLLGRFQEVTDCSSRRVLWSNVLHLIAQKPWLGWGWGELDYAHFITLYPGERFCDILDNAHNLPLHLAVELGVPVALGLCGLLLWWVVCNAPWAEKNATRQMAWAVLAVIGLHSLLEYPLWYGPFQLAVALCVFLLWQTRSHRENSSIAVTVALVKSAAPQTARALVFNGLAIVLLLVLAAAAWDYWRVSQLYLQPADRAADYREQTQDKVKDSWFFQDQIQFAELTTMPLTKNNAAAHYAQALRLLHFSPEPRVIEVAIESAVMLGKDEDALCFLQRYKAAFPAAHASWAAASDRFKAP